MGDGPPQLVQDGQPAMVPQMTKFDRPRFTDDALAPTQHDRRTVPAVELAPGLARAPRVAKLLNHAYDIANRELASLNEKHLYGKMDDDDWRKFGTLLKNLPALMREERAGDEQRMRLLGQLPEATLKQMVADYYGLAEEKHGTEEGQAAEVVEVEPDREEGRQVVEE
jgi:hypothetical protein